MAFQYILNGVVKLLNEIAKFCSSWLLQKKPYKWYHAKLKAYSKAYSNSIY